MDIQEFEELFGNTPFEDIEKIKKYIFQNHIPKSKIKEKIEELRKEPLKIKQNDKYYFVTDAYNKIIIQVLQEIIED